MAKDELNKGSDMLINTLLNGKLLKKL